MVAVQVVVEAPEVTGDTVVFRWSQSVPNPFRRKNEFFFRYEGVDLSAFSPLLFYELFLGFQLKVFAAYRRPVEVILPEPVPPTTVAYWRAFHDADLVTVSPLAAETSYSPWKGGVPRVPRPRAAAVFFGGGRDSMATACLLAEAYGREEVLLVQFVHPFRSKPRIAVQLERRQEELMLKPARERLGLATLRVWTDCLSQMLPEGYRTRPHAELYTLGALPALLAAGVSVATFCIEWTQYGTYLRDNGRSAFRYPKSRPEMLATQSRHYRRVLGVDVTVTDLNLLMSSPVAFRILKERYPRALEQIVMCVEGDVGERWCYRCRNCALYGLYCLAFGYLDPRFDFDRLLREAEFFRAIVDHATTGVELSRFGNAPPPPALGFTLYTSFYHVVARVDPGPVADRLGRQAYGNLMVAKALFGNHRFPAMEMMPTKALDLLGHPAARRIAYLITRHVEAADDLPGPFANADVVYDFGIRMSTRTGLLDHIRA